MIGLETTSEGSFGKLSSTITRGYPAVEVVKEDITKGNVRPRFTGMFNKSRVYWGSSNSGAGLQFVLQYIIGLCRV